LEISFRNYPPLIKNSMRKEIFKIGLISSVVNRPAGGDRPRRRKNRLAEPRLAAGRSAEPIFFAIN